jgi:hypothetical protein
MGLGQIDKIMSYKVYSKPEMLAMLQTRTTPDGFQRFKYDLVNPNLGCIHTLFDVQDWMQMVPLYFDLAAAAAARLDDDTASSQLSPSASQALSEHCFEELRKIDFPPVTSPETPY